MHGVPGPGVSPWYGLAGDNAQSGVVREHIGVAGKSLGLAKTFIVAEDEEAILEDGSTGRGSEHVPFERRIRTISDSVKVRPCVKCAVSQELVHAAVELVRAGPADRVHNAARSASVFGRESARQDLEFLNGVHPQYEADNISGRRHGVVVYSDSIDAVIVERRALTRNRHLATESAVAASGSRKRHLRLDLLHAGLQGGQLGPVASIQRQFADGLGFNLSRNRRRGQVDLRGRFRYLDFGGCLAYFQREVELQLLSDRKCDSRLHGRRKTGRGDLDIVIARQQVRNRIETAGVR